MKKNIQEGYDFSFNKNGKDYSINIIDSNGEIMGELLFSIKNINNTMLEIGYQNFSLENENSKKDMYDKIEFLLKSYKKTIKIEEFIISPEFRKMGNGKILFQEGLRYIKESLKINFIFLEVLPLENKTIDESLLIDIYSKHGFKKLSDNNRRYLMFKDEGFDNLKFYKKEKNIIENNNDNFDELLKIEDYEKLDEYTEDNLSNNYF
jgi:ribosomal protein S18 acetylase RimI-like enzyme